MATHKKATKATEAKGAVVSPDTTPSSSDAPDESLDLQSESEKKSPKVDTAKAQKGRDVYVAPGKAITTRSRGIISGDAKDAFVTADDFALGEKRIEQLIQAGYLRRK